MKASELLLQSAEPFDKACMIVKEMEEKLSKRIFRVQWYNSDGYGIWGHTTVVVQATSEEEAEEKAKSKIAESINGSVLDHLSQYESKTIEDITNKEILWIAIEAL